MRDKWSLLVVTLPFGDRSPAMVVIDFASPAWANTAYENLQHSRYVEVTKLY